MQGNTDQESKIPTKCSTQWQMEALKTQPEKTSYAFRLHIYTKGTTTFCPPETSPFSSCKHFV